MGVGAAPTVLFVSVEVTRGENVSIERDGLGRVGDNITCNIKCVICNMMMMIRHAPPPVTK